MLQRSRADRCEAGFAKVAKLITMLVHVSNVLHKNSDMI